MSQFYNIPKKSPFKRKFMKKPNFTYKKLKKSLEIGHEIEFVYDGVFCSINNFTDENHDSSWFFSTTFNEKSENTYLADFYDTETLMKSIDKIKVKEKSLEEVIEQALYDPLSLTIF